MRRTSIIVATVATLFTAGCSSSADLNAAPADGDRAAAGGDVNDLDRLVLELAAPVDGASARTTVRLLVWVDGHRHQVCGVEGHGPMAPGDRLEVTHFPDADQLLEEGLVAPAVDPAYEAGVSAPTEEQQRCMDGALPELGAVELLRGRWVDEQVLPLRGGGRGSALVDDAVDCVRGRAGLRASQVDDLDTALGIATRARVEEGLEGAELDRVSHELAVVFVECTEPFYDWQRERLLEARPSFQADHAETLAALSRALGDAGYTP